MNQEKNEKTLHGNAARIDPKKKVQSLYEANMVTVSHRTDENETPIVPDENVDYARRFSEENKK